MGKNRSPHADRRTSPLVLAMHTAALALFAVVIADAAGSLARALVVAGFVLVAASYGVARSRLGAPPRPPGAARERFATAGERTRETADLRVAA